MSEKMIMSNCWRQLYPPGSEKLLEQFLEELELLREGLDADTPDPQWYKEAIIYSLYVDLFNDNFPGLIEKLDYLEDLGVTCLWLLPILDSPMRDMGFDIRCYDRMRAELLGLCENAPGREQQAVFRHFLAEAKGRNIKVIFDMVVNHTSDEHQWFKQSRLRPDSPFRDYYIWNKDDQKYQGARLLFKGLCPSNWEKDGKYYYFHRFYEFQPDLNYRNPQVLLGMCRNLLYWLREGVDGFRLDAIPFLWKEEGTNCENLPQTHTIVRFFRAVMDYVRPGTLLLAEACQPPKDVVEYFGQGDECHAAYHFPLMPRIFLALAEQSRDPIISTLDPSITPSIPESSQWFLFLRCHDELTLEMVTAEERKSLNEYYLRDQRWSFREGEGISARLANLLDYNPRKIGLAYSIMLTLPGTPTIYSGDEFGKTNDEAYYEQRKEETGYTDSRNLVRGKINWEQVEENLKNPHSFAAQVFSIVRGQIRTRREHSCFGRGTLEWIEVLDDRGKPAPQVLAYFRTYLDEQIAVINNLSERELTVRLQIPSLSKTKEDLLQQPLRFDPGSGCLQLPPLAYYWIPTMSGVKC